MIVRFCLIQIPLINTSGFKEDFFKCNKEKANQKNI